jgi:hypothetical protein
MIGGRVSWNKGNQQADLDCASTCVLTSDTLDCATNMRQDTS